MSPMANVNKRSAVLFWTGGNAWLQIGDKLHDVGPCSARQAWQVCAEFNAEFRTVNRQSGRNQTRQTESNRH